MRHRIAERLELAVDRRQRGGSLLDELLELEAISLQLLLRTIELDEDRHLCPENAGHDWGEDEIDGTQVIAAAHVCLSLVERGHEDDRSQLRSRTLTDQLRGLEAIHDRHPDVEQHHREFLTQEPAKRIGSRSRLHDVFVQRLEDRPQREALGRVIVHDQDVDLGLAGDRRIARLARVLRCRVTIGLCGTGSPRPVPARSDRGLDFATATPVCRWREIRNGSGCHRRGGGPAIEAREGNR